MTRRERLEMVIAGNITNELIEECKVEIEKMDTANAKRTENASIMENIMGVVANSDEPILVDGIVEGLGVEGLTRQRVSSLCTILVKDGRLNSVDVKVKGKGKRKAYSIAE